MTAYKRKERGQASLVFIASLVIIMAAFALLVDGGRYLVMRNRARMIADASALSGASILDLSKVQEGSGSFDLDPVEARDVVDDTFEANNKVSPDWAEFQIVEIRVLGNEIWVTVTGTSAPLFGSNLGLNYSTTVISSARAGSGISSER